MNEDTFWCDTCEDYVPGSPWVQLISRWQSIERIDLDCDHVISVTE
jgi:hypothetical protein